MIRKKTKINFQSKKDPEQIKNVWTIAHALLSVRITRKPCSYELVIKTAGKDRINNYWRCGTRHTIKTLSVWTGILTAGKDPHFMSFTSFIQPTDRKDYPPCMDNRA